MTTIAISSKLQEKKKVLSMGTGGDEKQIPQPDRNSEKKLERALAHSSSGDLLSLWKSGSEEAAQILVTRYELRLMALVAARLNRKYRSAVSPEEVVQSALGSFFRVIHAGRNFSLEGDDSESAWKILATFTRRKLSRALERENAWKRGGNSERMSMDDMPLELTSLANLADADDLLMDLESLLSPDEKVLWEFLLVGFTQKEIAERMTVAERTIRRRITGLRERLAAILEIAESKPNKSTLSLERIPLPRISYRDFVLGKLVGKGSLGKVYRARLQSSDEVVAVKFMHRQFWEQQFRKHTFLQEIAQAAKVQHAGVVQYYGWGESPHGGPYLVSEFIDGETLGRVDSSNPETKLRWLHQVCEAVAACHRAGVVHGDLTPNNILVSKEGRIVITDFGFAVSRAWHVHDSSSSEGMLSRGGTLGFAAPEQISAAFGEVSPATDVYAIGGLACFLLTGHAPYSNSEGLLLETITENDWSVSFIPRSASEKKLLSVAQLGLKKVVASRPQSVQVLQDLLS